MKFFETYDAREGEKLKVFYKKLLDQVPDVIFKMVWYKDDLYSITYVSESVSEVYELTAEQILKTPDVLLKERIVDEDKPVIIEALQQSKSTLKTTTVEFKMNLPVKGLRWMKLIARPEKHSNGVINFYGRVADITEQKVQEQKMQKSQERYQFALQAASEGVWDWDIKNERIHFSAQTMHMLGFEETEIDVDQSFWLDRIHPDDAEVRAAAMKRGLKQSNDTYEAIYRVRTEDGTYRWMLSRGKAVDFDENGRAARAMGIHKDVTLLKEKEIELANTINIIGNQNNRLSNFAHIVSHNLRSHASNLAMVLNLLKEAEEDEKEEMMKHLEAISDGLSITISHLKELVEIQFEVKTDRQKLNLRHYLKNILTILHNEITKHGVTIEINIPLDVTVNYNPAYLESVLLNFTTNAIKYSNPDTKPMLVYDFEILNGQKVLSITDNGLGIDLKKHNNSLFGMYKTFHKHQNARGIGLFITKNQVEAMGGRIEVFSEVNKGTTFKIFFNEEDQ
jgi:PAS domain S-box-containing protein